LFTSVFEKTGEVIDYQVDGFFIWLVGMTLMEICKMGYGDVPEEEEGEDQRWTYPSAPEVPKTI